MKYVKTTRVSTSIGSIKDYFLLFNWKFKLTDMELSILSEFANLATDDDDLFSVENKKLVATYFNKKNPNSLNNYIKKFKEKEAVIYNNKSKTYRLHPLLLHISTDILIRLN